MSQMKKLLSLVVAIIMFATFVPALAFADTTGVVYLTVANTTFSASAGAVWDGKLLDNFEVEITSRMKAMDVVVEALEENDISQQGAEMGYITDVNGLGEFGASTGGGWMVLINDWFISAGMDDFYVSDGDCISLLYTSVGFGEDLGGSWANNDKKIKEITFSEGTLSEEFSPEIYEYTLTVPFDVESIKVTPVATNKNFQTRVYLNTEVLYGENGAYIGGEEEYEGVLCGLEEWDTLPENIGFYKKTQSIPVENGDVINVICGLPYWNSMNNGEFGSGAEDEDGCIYSFTIEKEVPIVETEEITVDIGVYDYTAVSYKKKNPDVEVNVSQNGIVHEEEYIVEEGKSVLEALKEAFEYSQIEYSLDESGTYFTMINGLSELDSTSESGWMISVNDEFLTVSASEKILNNSDKVKLHYSVEGWGTDVGNYFVGGPTLRKITLGGVVTTISQNTIYEDENDWTGTTTYYLGEYVENGRNKVLQGDGSIETPFVIPIKVGSGVNIKSLTATIDTTLHKEYLQIGEGEGLTDILTSVDYGDDITFGIETLGGFYKTYYTVKVTKETSGGFAPSSRPEPEKEEPEDESKEEVKEENIHTVMTETAESVHRNVPFPKVGSIGGEWAIIALARSGVEIENKYYADYYNEVKKYVAEKNGVLHNRKYTEYSRVILALTAIGKNPMDVSGHNLLLPLGDFEKTIWQGVNGAIWALIALDCAPYDIPQNPDAKIQATREMYIEYILESQNTDGGWALSKEMTSDIDITAMAISSLSGYLSTDRVNSAVEKALAFLETRQNDSGGFSGGESCESSAQVLSALCALGIEYDSPRFVKDGKTVLDDLLSYRNEKGFKHTRDGSVNQMATEQACYALVSLYRFENGMPKINDMTDVIKIAESESIDKESADTKETFFSDTVNHKNESAIKALAEKGIVNGKSEGIFDPENTMTRAEFATIIVRALGLELKETKVFSDVCENDWFYSYVATAYEVGIINGVGDNMFNPHGTITRQESATMLVRWAKLRGMNTDMEVVTARDILAMYIDYIKTSDWAINPLAFCISEGIINEEGLEILPQKEATRAEIAQMVYNLLERVGKI